jgi:hypothetical protein
LCGAAGVTGFIVSSDPGGGASAWRRIRLGEADVDGYTSIACAGTHLCVATDLLTGRIAVASDPLSARSWGFRKLVGAQTDLTGVSCPSRRLCVVVDYGGDVLSSADPTGRAATWRRVRLPHQHLTAVSCASTTLCVAIGRGNLVAVSTDPSFAHPRWKTSVIDRPLGALSPPDTLSTVACAPHGPCIIGDDSGNVIIGR